MGLSHSPRITTDGLVLALDAGNSKSYPGILDNIVGWRLPSTNYIRGTLLDNDRTWSSEPSSGYSSVILNKTFNAGENFEVIAYWARDYRGIGMVYGPNVSIFDFTGYSVDGNGPYFGALNTSGFPSGYSATFFGQYHSPIQGQGAQTTGYWFKWARTLNTLSLQYSATSSSGPWTNILADVSINSTDKVIIGAGEASSNEVSDLSLISVGPGPYTWTDLSGNRNFGTTANGPTYSSANGGSLVFGGTNDYVTVPDNSSLDLSGDKTLSCWVYMGADSSGCGIAGKMSSSVYGMALAYGWLDNGFQAIAWNSTNNPYISKDLSRDINKWVHITAVQNGSTRWIYVWDGTGVRSSSYSGGTHSWDNNVGFYVGCQASLSNFVPSNTRIAQVQIYNRALTQAEIQQNFNATRGRYGI